MANWVKMNMEKDKMSETTSRGIKPYPGAARSSGWQSGWLLPHSAICLAASCCTCRAGGRAAGAQMRGAAGVRSRT
eukprot:3612935-Prymnesium_polylepis.1